MTSPVNEFKNNSIMQQLHDLVFVDKVNLSCNFVCKKFQIHISEAIKLLEEFYTKFNKNQQLSVCYAISGSDNSDDSIVKLQRLSIVEEKELESSKKLFSNCDSYIYSIGLTAAKQEPYLNFEQFILEPSQENFDKLQSLTYIAKSEIATRPPRRGSADLPKKISNSAVKNEIKKEGSITEIKKEGSMTEIKMKKEDDVIMDIDPVKQPLSPKKRLTTKNETNGKKRFKRIRIDSSDDEDEEYVMKENVSKTVTIEDGFTVTKLETNDDVKKTSPPVKPKIPLEEKIKPAVKSKQNGTLKPNIKTQTSITSFFKRPAK